MGYLRLAGQDAVRRVSIPLVQRAMCMEAFVPRQRIAEALPAVAALSGMPSVRKPILDADAILGDAHAAASKD